MMSYPLEKDKGKSFRCFLGYLPIRSFHRLSHRPCYQHQERQLERGLDFDIYRELSACRQYARSVHLIDQLIPKYTGFPGHHLCWCRIVLPRPPAKPGGPVRWNYRQARHHY